MDKALQKTHYCDFDHPRIKKISETLSEKADDKKSIARIIFQYVREEIIYGFDIYRKTASATLDTGYGVCWNKSLLLTSLLRSNNIPAHIGTVSMRRQFVAPTAGSLHKCINEPFQHFLVFAQIGKQWVVLDAVLDSKTYEHFYRRLDVKWGIDWDGQSDCVLYPEHRLGQPELHENLDELIHSRAGNKEWPGIFAKATNMLLNKRLWKKTGRSFV